MEYFYDTTFHCALYWIKTAQTIADLIDNHLACFELSIEKLKPSFTFVTDFVATMPSVLGASVSPNRVSFFERCVGCGSHQLDTATNHSFDESVSKTSIITWNIWKKLLLFLKRVAWTTKFRPDNHSRKTIQQHSDQASTQLIYSCILFPMSSILFPILIKTRQKQLMMLKTHCAAITHHTDQSTKFLNVSSWFFMHRRCFRNVNLRLSLPCIQVLMNWRKQCANYYMVFNEHRPSNQSWKPIRHLLLKHFSLLTESSTSTFGPRLVSFIQF